MKTTEKRVRANQKNARASTGPKTASGKQKSSLNALRHGLYSPAVRDEERPEFEALRRALEPQFPATTALRVIAFGQIMDWIRIGKKAARLEIERLDSLLYPSGQQSSPGQKPGDTVADKWYTSGQKPLRDSLSVLQSLKLDVKENGEVREDWKPVIAQCFGAEYVDCLTQWKPGNRDAILLANHLVSHAETFKRPLPPLDACRRELVVDPRLCSQMIMKLIDVKIRHLQDIEDELAQIRRSAGEERVNLMDASPRYLTAAMRGLHHAVEWFHYLVANDK